MTKEITEEQAFLITDSSPSLIITKYGIGDNPGKFLVPTCSQYYAPQEIEILRGVQYWREFLLSPRSDASSSGRGVMGFPNE